MTRRQLNTKFLAFLFFTPIALIIGAYFVHQKMTERSANSLLARAEKAEKQAAEGGEQEELKKALEYLERYLSYKPSDVATLAKFGLLMDRYGASLDEAEESSAVRLGALPVFEKVLQRNPGGESSDNVRSALVTLVLATAKSPEQFSQAETHLERLIKNAERNKSPNLADLYGKRGKLRLGTTKPEEAVKDFTKAIELQPTLVEYYLPLATTLRELKEPQRADDVMENLVKNNPQDPKAYLARVAYRVKNDNLLGARADAAEALVIATRKKEPNADAYFAAAGVELMFPNMSGKLDSARDSLKQAIKIAPKRRELYLALADLEERDNKPEAAEEVLAMGDQAIPKSYDLAYVLADTFIDHKKTAKARPIIARLRNEPIQKAPIDLLEARALVADGQWLQGVAALEAVRPALEGEGYNRLFRILADMDLAHCYRQLNRPGTANTPSDAEKEIAAYRRVLQTNSDYTPARLNLATALLQQDPNNPARAAEAFQILQGSANSADAALLQVRLAANAILRQPNSRRDWTSVLQQLDDLEKQSAGRTNIVIPILLMRAEIDVSQGQLERARQRLRDARAAHLDDPAYWLAEVRFNQQIKQLNDAIKLLEEADLKFGPRVDLFAARIQFWTRASDKISKQALINMMGGITKLPAERQDAIRELLAQALVRAGAPEQALELIKAVAAKDPNNLRSQSNLFDMALRAGDDALVRTSLDNMRRLDGEQGIQWRFASAAYAVAQARKTKDLSRLPEAKRLIDEIRKLGRPTWSRLSVLEADIAKLEGNNEQAIEALNRAISEGERHTAVIRELAQLYYAEKRYEEADAAIKNLESQGALETDLKRLASEASLEVHDKEQALRLAGEAVSPDSTDYRDHVWLGQIRAAAGDAKSAEDAFERAVKIAPTTPETWLSLVQFLIRHNRRADAEKALERAKAALPADVAALTLAQGYKLVGRNDLSEELLDKALNAKPGDPTTIKTAAEYHLAQGRVDRAEAIVKPLLDPKAAQNDRFWARRTLAVAFFDSGLADRIKDALTLIEANLAETPDSPKDQYIRAVLLTAFPARRKEAIPILEKLQGQFGKSMVNSDIVLAQLHDAEGDWTKARTLFQTAIGANPKAPNIRIAYIKALIRHDEFDEAIKSIEILDTLGYSSLQTLGMKANLLKRQGKTDQAIQQVREFAQKNPAQAKGAAELFELLGDTATAEAMFKERAEQKDRPENLLTLAAYYGRQNRPQEAIDTCDQARQANARFDLVLATAFSALGFSQPSPELLQRVESWIDEAEKTEGGKNKHINQRGLLMALAGRHKDAEALYRKAIAANSADIMALNNLAWLLAQTGGDTDEALKLIDRAIGTVGFNPALYDTRAMVHLARNRADLAISDLRRVIDTRKDPSYYFHLARALVASNKQDAAANAMKTAESLGLKPSDIDALERDAYASLVAQLQKTPPSATEEPKN